MRSSNGSGSTAKRSRGGHTGPAQPVATSTAPTSRHQGGCRSGSGARGRARPRTDHHPVGGVGDHLAGRLLGDPGQHLAPAGSRTKADARVDLQPAQQRGRAAVAQHQRASGARQARLPRLPPGSGSARAARPAGRLTCTDGGSTSRRTARTVRWFRASSSRSPVPGGGPAPPLLHPPGGRPLAGSGREASQADGPWPAAGGRQLRPQPAPRPGPPGPGRSRRPRWPPSGPGSGGGRAGAAAWPAPGSRAGSGSGR